MLNTINGFDLILIIIIVIAGFKIYNLTKECESYVAQIETMTNSFTNIMNDLVVPLKKLVDHHSECNCKDCYIRVVPPAKHEYQSYCDCNKCIPF
jgi:hypothetical protein